MKANFHSYSFHIMYSIVFTAFIALIIVANVAAAPAAENGRWNIKTDPSTASIGVVSNIVLEK